MNDFGDEIKYGDEVKYAASVAKKIGRAVLSVIGVIIVFCLIMGSFYTIDAGDKGVVKRFGDVIKIAEPGINFKFPIVDDVVVISTRQQTIVYSEESRLSSYTKDQQNAYVSVAFTFNVTDPMKVYENYRSTENVVTQLIKPGLSQQAEGEMSKYTAADAVDKRDQIAANYAKRIKDIFADKPISVNNVVLSDLSFDKEYETVVARMVEKNVEEKAALKQRDIEMINADIARTKAQGEADAKVIAAKAEADKVRLQGEAEAASIDAKARALEKQGRNLVDLTIAEKWTGQLPTTMTPSSALPLLNINPNKSE